MAGGLFYGNPLAIFVPPLAGGLFYGNPLAIFVPPLAGGLFYGNPLAIFVPPRYIFRGVQIWRYTGVAPDLV